MTIKNIGDYESMHGVNPLYLIIGDVDGYIEESHGNKQFLVFASTNQNKDVLTKYTELWNGSKNLIEKINDKPGKYGKDFIKIKFNSDGNLPLNKIINLHNLPVVARSVFQEDNIIHKWLRNWHQ